MNAQHARDFARCTREETVALLRRGVATAARVVRDLSDDELAKKGNLMVGAPPMTTEQVITSGLLHHLDDHFASIRKTAGH